MSTMKTETTFLKILELPDKEVTSASKILFLITGEVAL
jgi:hypothetical protein